MSEFMVLDPKAPATLGAVVEAVARLSTLSEARILELVSDGDLANVFPFQPHTELAVPADTVSEDELVEASAMPLSADQREALVEASLPASSAGRRRRA